MEAYDSYPHQSEFKQIGSTAVIGVVAAATYLLARLISVGELSLITWTDAAAACLIGVIVWGLSTLGERLILRLLGGGVAPDPVQPPPPASNYAAVSFEDVADRSWQVPFDRVFTRRTAFLAGQRIAITAEQYEWMRKIAEARWNGDLDFVSERKLDSVGVNRFNGDAKDAVTFLFNAGLLRKDGQVYAWTERGRAVFPDVRLPSATGGEGGGEGGEAPPPPVVQSASVWN